MTHIPLPPLFECRKCGIALLQSGDDLLQCPRCGRQVTVSPGFWSFLGEGFALPEFGWRSKESYRQICAGEGPSQGWGADSGRHRGVARLRNEQTGPVLDLDLLNSGVLIDVSAGCGHQLARCANKARIAVHWEAHTASLRYAANLYARLGVDNIILCRGSYLELGLRPRAADVVMCFDTFERGESHDLHLLREMERILKPDGRAFVDYHFRGVTNHSIRCYTDREVDAMAREAGLEIVGRLGIGWGPTVRRTNVLSWQAGSLLARVLRRPSRKLCILKPRCRAQELSEQGTSRTI